MHLQISSKFLELLKSAGKRVLTSWDTCRTRRVPGGGVSRCGLSGHAAHSDDIRRVSRCWLSGHVAHSDGIRRVSQCGLSGHVAHPESARGWLSRLELSGHVAYPECSRGDSPGWSSRDTWRTRNAPGVILPVGALGTRGVPGMLPG